MQFYEVEELARYYQEEAERPIPEHERQRLRYLAAMEARRRRDRQRRDEHLAEEAANAEPVLPSSIV